jgi:hypothetical protein
LPFGQIFALATLGLVGSMALVGLINVLRWAMSLPPEADLATLPPIVLMGFAKLALQVFAGVVGFVCILFGNRRVALVAAISTIAILLALHLASWMFGPSPMASGFLARHGVRIAFAVWLIFVLGTLLPNGFFKRNTLRTSP